MLSYQLFSIQPNANKIAANELSLIHFRTPLLRVLSSSNCSQVQQKIKLFSACSNYNPIT